MGTGLTYLGHRCIGRRTASVWDLLLQWQQIHQRLVAVTLCTSCCRHSGFRRSVVHLQVLH